MAALQLKEILFEITSKCNKNCKYCGSNKYLNQKDLNSPQIEKILQEIISYPPEYLTLSGGEPCLSEHFEHVVNVLSKKIAIKTLTNGELFKYHKTNSTLLHKIQRVGYSVNTKEDIADSELFVRNIYPEKITMISNFGNHNIFQFKPIYDFFIKNNFKYWQVQLTMGDFQLDEDGISYLIDELNKVTAPNIVYADNLQNEYRCTAGINTCSILYDGNVVSCLSKRCWDTSFNGPSEGNLVGSSLKDIWENGFKNERFGCAKCCRDCIKYPKNKLRNMLAESLMNPIKNTKQNTDYPPYLPYKNTIQMYGCWDDNTTFLYGTI